MLVHVPCLARERERERGRSRQKMLPKKEAQRTLGVLSFPPLEFVLNVGYVGWAYLNPSEILCLECKG